MAERDKYQAPGELNGFEVSLSGSAASARSSGRSVCIFNRNRHFVHGCSDLFSGAASASDRSDC